MCWSPSLPHRQTLEVVVFDAASILRESDGTALIDEYFTNMTDNGIQPNCNAHERLKLRVADLLDHSLA